MDFKLTKEQALIQKMVRDFTENEIRPIAAETDRTSEYPAGTIDKLFDLGVMGMDVPKEYGGPGADAMSCALAIEEISKVCASTGDILASQELCTGPIINFGNEEQKKKYLPQLCGATARKMGAFALTEPDAGSDASKGTTVAVLEGDHYVLNGAKCFITNGYVCDIIVVFAKTAPEKGTKGISAFIVEKEFPGFSVGKHEVKMGLHGSPTAELVFQDCIVPKENLLGQEGKGFNIALATLDAGRIGIAAQALGIAEGAWNETKTYINSRVQFGKPIAKFQNTQFVMADLYMEIEAGRGLLEKAVEAKNSGKKFSVEAACAKLFCSELCMKATTRCLQFFGGYGYTNDFPLERMMRDAKITEIYEGTSEIQRVVISANVL